MLCICKLGAKVNKEICSPYAKAGFRIPLSVTIRVVDIHNANHFKLCIKMMFSPFQSNKEIHMGYLNYEFFDEFKALDNLCRDIYGESVEKNLV